ncbi:MAG TPA: hypothetical protein PK788_10115 [Gemmatimonadaceae bacterium]|nr:hypothetical protein [Gemmatimonadaceae bacterium]
MQVGILGRADAPRDGTTPTLLYGYGGFQISQLPSYSAIRGKLWLERGGAFAVTNRRGVEPMWWPIRAAAASSGRPGTRPRSA